MAPPLTPAPLVADPVSSHPRVPAGEGSSTGSSRLHADLQVPRPDLHHSGMYPAFEPPPRPIAHGVRRLRQAVLLTVIVGAVSLLAYASWSRVAQTHPVASIVVSHR